MGKQTKEEWRGQKYHDIPVLNESQMKSKDDEPSKTEGDGKDDGYDSGGGFPRETGSDGKRFRGHKGGSLGGASLEVSVLLETRLKLFWEPTGGLEGGGG